jgi:hypothetical protein
MKKHPVDDLFKRKLADLQRQPSSAAWSRIEATQKPAERKLTGWVWYAAASVTIVFMAGYLVWSGQSSKPDSTDKQLVTTVEAKKAVRPVGELPKADNTVSTLDADLKVAAVQKKTSKNVGKKEPKARLSVPDLEKQHVAQSGEVKQIKIERLAAIGELPVKADGPVVLPEPQKTVMQEPLMAVKPEQEDSRTIVVNVSLPEQDGNDKPKTSKFAKVFRQLKNLREGEPVDWEDVGFNPKTVVARVDDRIREGEEKVTGKYRNFKERTKL